MSIGNVIVGDERGSERRLWDRGGYGLDGFLRHDRRKEDDLRHCGWIDADSDGGFLRGGLWSNYSLRLDIRSRIEPLCKVSLKVQVPEPAFKVQVSEKRLLIRHKSSRDTGLSFLEF